MVYINEWLPNPIGSDTCKLSCGWNIEFVELFNDGRTSDGISSGGITLNGWFLWTGGKSKKIPLDVIYIPAGGYAIIKKPQVKISLKNADGGLWLYGPAGKLVDRAAFVGTAQEGKSFSRVDYSAANITHFAFVDSTPGAVNKTINNQVTVRHYPAGMSLVPGLTGFQMIGFMMAAAITIFAAWIYIIKTNETLSDIFFPRDTGTR